MVVEADLLAVQSWAHWGLTSGEVNTALSAERGLSAVLLAAVENAVQVGRMESLLNYLKMADPGSAPVPYLRVDNPHGAEPVPGQQTLYALAVCK